MHVHKNVMCFVIKCPLFCYRAPFQVRFLMSTLFIGLFPLDNQIRIVPSSRILQIVAKLEPPLFPYHMIRVCFDFVEREMYCHYIWGQSSGATFTH